MQLRVAGAYCLFLATKDHYVVIKNHPVSHSASRAGIA
jgi:hypothetical protein